MTPEAGAMCPNQNLLLEDGYMLPGRKKVCQLSERTECDLETENHRGVPQQAVAQLVLRFTF
jgi:hypothetical protein